MCVLLLVLVEPVRGDFGEEFVEVVCPGLVRVLVKVHPVLWDLAGLVVPARSMSARPRDRRG